MDATCVVVPPKHFESCSPNMKVNIINDVSSDEDEDEDGGDEDWDGYDDDYYERQREDSRRDLVGLEDPYEPGGAFNDPFFDEYYSLHFQTVR